MQDLYNNFISFFAIWFNDLKKHSWKVQVTNAPAKDPVLENKLNELIKTLKVELNKTHVVAVNNPSTLNTSGIEKSIADVSKIISNLKPSDLGDVEDLLKGIIDAVRSIPEPKTPVVNIPETKFPKSLEISNLPKVQKVEGTVDVDFNSVIAGLQVVVDAINDLKLDMGHEMKNMGATYAGQTGSRSAIKITDGENTVSVTNNKLDVNATASLAGEALPIAGATTAVGVAIVDSSGNQISSFGGGTQYTEGDTDATITGTAALVEGAANALAVLTQPLTDTQLRATAVPISVATIPSHAVTNAGTFAVQVTSAPSTTVTATDLDIRNLTNTDVVTAELSAVDNAVLDTIAAKDFATQTTLALVKAKTDNIPALGQALAAASVPVILPSATITTLTPPAAITGFATSAKQDTLDTSINTLLKPASTLAAVTTVGAVTSITNALPAGTNAIGKLAANSGVDIGDTDVTSIIPGTGATNLGKAEDGAHTSGDVGIMGLGVRNDTMADFTGADNDYTPRSVTAKGQTITANAPRGRKLHQITTITSSTTETTVLTAAASTYHDVYGVIVTNTSATATEVHFKDATAGTTRFTISVPANDMRGFMLPIDAAVVASGTNANWTATCVDSVASIIITVFGVKNL